MSDSETNYNYQSTQVVYSRHAGDVTYQSASTYRNYYAYMDQTPYEYSYSYNYDYSGKSGMFTNLGSQYGLDVTLKGADGTVYSAAPRMSFTTDGNTFSNDFCWNYDYGYTSGKNCYDDFYTYQTKFGYAFAPGDNQ